MPLRILSFFIEGVTWRVAQTPDGYCHRALSNIPDWVAGIPSGITLDTVENMFQQFAPEDHSTQPQNINFKLTYRDAHSNMECFIFFSPEDDLFSVNIPSTTFATLQKSFPSETIPSMRVARLAVHQAIASGFPSITLVPGTPLYDTIQSHLSKSFSPKTSP